MNQEMLKFIKGETAQALPAEGFEPSGDYEALIHIVGKEVWLGRIAIYGASPDDAEGLRDRVLWALDQPTVPAQWQAAHDGCEIHPTVDWFNIDNGGEAARLKGLGFRIRALYVKQPLK